MVLVGGADDDEEGEDAGGGGGKGAKTAHPNGPSQNGLSNSVSHEEQEARTRAIVSSETAAILGGLGPGPLDVRIKRLADNRDDLQVREKGKETEFTRLHQKKNDGLLAVAKE